jgi:hypothetical protein
LYYLYDLKTREDTDPSDNDSDSSSSSSDSENDNCSNYSDNISMNS